MTFLNPERRSVQASERPPIGPLLGFAIPVLLVFAAMAIGHRAWPLALTLAIIATIFYASAAVIAVAALRRRERRAAHVTYWDVAGALTLLGVASASMVSPEELPFLLESTRRN